jgi:hypothetical protein
MVTNGRQALNEALDATERNISPQLHVLWEGVTHDIDLASLDVGDLSTDTQVRNAVADYLEVVPAKLSNATIDRNAQTQDITLRPNAVFGK